MCPACLGAFSMLVAGLISTAAMTRLGAKTLGGKNSGVKARGGSVNPGKKESRSLKDKEKQS
jgi:hypothetical protein